MVSKNIAFVGAPGVDKTILQMKAADILDGEYRYRVTNRIEKKVIDSINENRIDLSHFDQEIDIISAFIRRAEILAVNSDWSVIADEWVLQELANTMVKMNNLQEKLKTAAQVLGPDGKPIFTEDYGKFVIMQATFQVLLNQVAIEKDFWNFLYYVPINELDYDTVDEEGVKPKDRLHQKEIDIALQTLIGQLKLDVVVLPVDTDESFKILEGEKRKWTEQMITPFATPELIRSQELYRANAIVEAAERDGKNIAATLREYGVSSSIINEIGLKPVEYTPKSKKVTNQEKLESWAKDNVGNTTVGGLEIAKAIGVSYPTANNFVQARPDIFFKVKKGEYVVRDADAERKAAKEER